VVRVFLLLLLLFVIPSAWPQSATSLEQVARIYVDSFGDSAEAQQVRQAVMDELHRHGKPAAADSEAQSDAVLSGSGEVWVKGYYSLNPRARTIGAGAHPIYGGYLSVELKGRQHEVLWSYLVTPQRFGPEPIARNLAAQLVKKLREAATH
jgi:hypothetical protein